MAVLRSSFVPMSGLRRQHKLEWQATLIYIESTCHVTSVTSYFGYHDVDYTVTAKLYSNNAGTIGTTIASGEAYPITAASGGLSARTLTLPIEELTAGYYWLVYGFTDLDESKYLYYSGVADVNLGSGVGWETQVDPPYAFKEAGRAATYGFTTPLGFSLIGSAGLSKPTNPSPANGAGPGIDFSSRTLSWENGGGAETYTVRMDPGDTPYNVVSLSQTGTSYTIPEADISRYQDNIISWRVDAEAGGETVTGDVWTFDPRPAKATTPSPTNGASNTALNLTTLSWVKDAYTDKSEVNCDWSGSVSPFSTSSNSIALANYTPLYMDRLGYSNTYTWSVDTTNEWGTTDGDDWTFDTISYAGASCSWKNYDGKTLGPFDGGLEGVDYYWLGTNCISTVKRVVAFAADRVWITEV